MEYRRKRKSVYRPRHAGGYAAYIGIAAVFLGIVYLLGASKASGWIIQKWLIPAFSKSDADDLQGENQPMEVIISHGDHSTESPDTQQTPLPDRETVTIEMPALSCFGLQMGAYQNEENASAQADALRAMGGAGYVVFDGERYRVLAAGYPEKKDAASVQEQLLLEGVDSRIYQLPCGNRTLKITAVAGEIQKVRELTKAFEKLPGQLYQAALAFDEKEAGQSEPLADLLSCKVTAEQLLVQARLLLNTGDDGEMQRMADALAKITDRIQQVLELESSNTAALSSGCKQCYLLAVQSYHDYTCFSE